MDRTDAEVTLNEVERSSGLRFNSPGYIATSGQKTRARVPISPQDGENALHVTANS